MVKKMKVKKQPPTKRRKPAVLNTPVRMGNGNINMYEGHVYKRPKRGDAVLYVTNTRINKTRTFTGLDYEVGLMGIYSRSDLRASIFRENDTHANQFLFFAKEKITKLRERVFEMEYSFEIAGMY